MRLTAEDKAWIREQIEQMKNAAADRERTG